MTKENLLIIFAKNPVAGKVKTRIAQDLGKEAALEIYRFLLKHTARITSAAQVAKRVYYSENIMENDLWDNRIFDKKLQQGADLGERMFNAFKEGFQDGFSRIVIIGSDLYNLEISDIDKAFTALQAHDYVIGPAADGGYYLLGMNSLNSTIFRNKNWGTSCVLQDTLGDLQNADIKLLETKNDIDVLEDIKDHPAFQNFIKK